MHKSVFVYVHVPFISEALAKGCDLNPRAIYTLSAHKHRHSLDYMLHV